jgi:two-component system sensor histidine kinase VicK
MLIINEEDLDKIMLSAPIGICILNADTLVSEMVNDKFLEIAGKPFEAIHDKFYWQAFPEARLSYEAALNQVVQSGETYYANEVELMLIRNGREDWVFVTFVYSPVRTKNGKITKVAIWVLENTSQVKSRQAVNDLNARLGAANEELAATNEELAASNEELIQKNDELALLNQQLLVAQRKIEEGQVAFRLAVNAANFGTWFIHSVTREFITDARLKELFGYYPEESLSIEQALAQISEEYRDFVTKKLENAIYRNGDYDVTYPVSGLHDKRLRWLRAIGNLKVDPSGKFSAFTGVVMDITEQHLAAAEINRAEENLRMAVNAAGLGTFYINATDRDFVTSPKLKEFFGYFEDEALSLQAAMNQIHPDYRTEVADLAESAFTNGTPFDIEYPIIGRQDGKTRWVRGIGQMQHREGGDLFAGVLHEITERKQDEIRKNDFIGMVSHELKTPLTSMKGYIQLLLIRSKKREDESSTGALEKANAQVTKMTNMINGFLNISRLESGKIHIDRQRFDLSRLVEEIEEETSAIIVSHRVIFESVEGTFVNADRDKIGQVIHNLVSNAIKYSTPGSIVNVKCYIANGSANISVDDNGMGIKPDDISKIFDRYYRVEGRHMNSTSGFGIGLYLCAEIINRHYGEIWAESEFGKGSTFRFTLPLSEG